MDTIKLCECKKSSGYTVGYICRSCKKPIYTPAQSKEVDALRAEQEKHDAIMDLMKQTDTSAWESVEAYRAAHNGELPPEESH